MKIWLQLHRLAGVHRQLMSHFCSNVKIAESFDVWVSCTHPKTNKDALEKASIFLPHMTFAALGQNYPEVFSKLFGFGKGTVADFWKEVAKTDDAKLKNHPMSLEKDWENTTIPLFVHGDGAEYSNNDNLLVFSWGCLASNLPTLLSHWLLACFPKSCGKKETWQTIWKQPGWSFEALACGRHPTKDPDGKPLEKGAVFFSMKGQPPHQGFKGVVWSIIGDHEYFSNTLGLPHWSSHYPRWERDAENFTPCTFGKGYKEICLEKQKFDVYTNENCLVDPWSDHSLFKLPGTSSCMVRGDPLHVLFCKVLYSHLMGGILHYLCYCEGPGVRAAKKPTERLPVLFSQVQVHYTQQQCKNMLTNLRLSMICDPSKPWSKHPVLDCKGGESRHLPCSHPCPPISFCRHHRDLWGRNAERSHQFGKACSAVGWHWCLPHSSWIWADFVIGWFFSEKLCLAQCMVFGKGPNVIPCGGQTS